MIKTIYFINYFILIFFIFTATMYTLVLLSSFSAILQFFKRTSYTNIYDLLKSKYLPPLTIITPVFNEASRIVENVLSSLQSDYPNLFILLINDGSTDKTMEIIVREFEMFEEPLIFEQHIETAKIKAVYVSKKYPNLTLIDKEHSNVGDTLNVGINACFTPYFATVDADSTLDKSAISEMMFELLSDPHAIAIGGAVYIRNACIYKDGKMIEARMPYSIVPAIQATEYLRSHLFNRTGWNRLGTSMSYSGTASLFSLAAVRSVNGYDTNNFAQDTEMVMRLHSHMRRLKTSYQILFNPVASVFTEVPKTLKQLCIQRERWQRGMLKSILNYKYMFFNPKYKIQGLLSYPIYVILEIIAPFIEFTAYITLPIAYFLGILNGTSVLLYMLLAWGFIAYLTMANTLIHLMTFNVYKRMADVIWMLALSFIEMFGFRQILVGVKVYATFHYLINRIRGKAI